MMTEYERGFVEGLQAACKMLDLKWKFHLANAQDASLAEADREAAFNCTGAIGNAISDLKCLGAQVHRKETDPSKIAAANGAPFWWATVNGKGQN